jgi:glycosyltransferase involved in cell wall biosynthesis
MRLAIIIPTLNEAATIEEALARLAPLRARGVKVVVADGGSSDDTVARAAPLADRVLGCPRGRGLQMNCGARAPEAAEADVLLFLHADTVLPPEADRIVLRALSNSLRVWGRFDVEIDDWDNARIVLPGGQAGHPLSPHYDDLLAHWLRGETVPLAWSEEAVAQVAAERLTLMPR